MFQITVLWAKKESIKHWFFGINIKNPGVDFVKTLKLNVFIEIVLSNYVVHQLCKDF